jgi:hypothetical protein
MKKQKKKVCSVKGCGRLVYAKGLCRPHYWRQKTHGDIQADIPIRSRDESAGDGPCSVRGCEQVARAHHLCTTHYYRHRKYGDVFENIPVDQQTKGLPLPERARRAALPAGRRFCPGCKQDKDVKQFSRSVTYCKRCARAQQLKHKYGLTLADYDRMLAAQRGRCAICGSTRASKNNKKAFAVDHDHSTGQIRGLLCISCNHYLLGILENSDASITRLREYLNRAVEAREESDATSTQQA